MYFLLLQNVPQDPRRKGRQWRRRAQRPRCMCRGASSPTLAKDMEVNKFSELGRQGCMRTSFSVGKVGQTPGPSDNHTLLRAHTWCTEEQKAGQFGKQCSIPNPSALVRTLVPIPGRLAESLSKLREHADSWGPAAVLPSQNHMGWGNWGMCVQQTHLGFSGRILLPEFRVAGFE